MSSTGLADISNGIKTEALRLGFSACGISEAEAVDVQNSASVQKWLQEGCHASMLYMEANIEKRLDPRLLHPGCQSIISVALNYYPHKIIPAENPQFALYSYGKDYHDVMKLMLNKLGDYVKGIDFGNDGTEDIYETDIKICCDTVPILDRYWAWKAGLGWIGKNSNLIIPKCGSYFFLGEILVNRKLRYDTPMQSQCGSCCLCINNCPTGALGRSKTVDARKCLSFLTIENKELSPIDIRMNITENNYIYGCDRCQSVCPYNKYAVPTNIEAFNPSEELLEMKKEDWLRLNIEQYRRLFKGSAVKRAKYDGLMRNIKSFLK
jgi:epoxyqueuosine reductase